MEKISVNQIIKFAEHDGIVSKRIEKILWSEKGKRHVFYSKDTVLVPALDWCIVLFSDGTYCDGWEIQKNVDNGTARSLTWTQKY